MENVSRKDVVKMMDFCINKWGMSRFHDSLPKLRVYSKPPKDEPETFGYFNEDSNIIIVYIKPHKSMLDICDTIIHEYTHYLQDIIGMYGVYLYKYKRNYENHPYEVTAFNRGRRYRKQCLEYTLKSS